MRWLGLTGGIASGKSSVSRILIDQGLVVVDADLLAREVVQPGTRALAEIARIFGSSLIGRQGDLDRKRLGEIVFADPVSRARLESVIHPEVRALAQKRRQFHENRGEVVCFYDVPLLFEKKLASEFDRTIVVVCSPENQIVRLMARDGLSREAAQARISAQMPLSEKARFADDVIENDGSLNDLEGRVRRFVSTLHQAQA